MAEKAGRPPHNGGPMAHDPEWRLDHTAVSVASNFEEAERLDREHFRSLTPIERLRALEFSRQVAFGYGFDKPLPRFQRLLEVAELR